jgi:hypothetical protein
MWRVEYNTVCREMGDWLGAGDSRSWNDAVLGVCLTWCKLMIIGWRDRAGRLDFVFFGDGRESEKWQEVRGIIMRNWAIREFCVWINLLFLIWHILLPIRQVITPIWYLLNQIRQVVPLTSHIHSYLPYRSHLHPPFLSVYHRHRKQS